MIPPPNSAVWRKIATGKLPIPSQSLAVNLLTKNLHRSYTADSSVANVEALARRAHDFFVQYERVLKKELAMVAKEVGIREVGGA